MHYVYICVYYTHSHSHSLHVYRAFKEHVDDQQAYIDSGRKFVNKSSVGAGHSGKYSEKQIHAAATEILSTKDPGGNYSNMAAHVSPNKSTPSGKYYQKITKSSNVIVTSGVSAKGSSTNMYIHKDFTISQDSECSDKEEDEDNEDEDDVIINEHVLFIGMCDEALINEEQIAMAKRYQMHFYCQKPMEISTLYGILGMDRMSHCICMGNYLGGL